MVNKDKIRDKVNFIENSIDTLRHLGKTSQAEFIADPIKYHAAVRLLQIAIEAMIDMANHIVSQKRLGVPKTYSETFKLLAQAGILPWEMLSALQVMVKFRNRAVHLYDEVDAEEIYRIIHCNLGDLEDFLAVIVRRFFA